MDASKFKRFDMKKHPQNLPFYLKPIVKLLVNPGIREHKPQITYCGTENIKGPFLLLCNHNAFLDFKVANYLLKKNKANYIVAIDGYLNREWLLRKVGCICKRKFTNDVLLVRQLKRALQMGNVAVIYPEARYSLCGTTAVLPESLGQMAKLFKVPVVTLICHGHHINSPFWDTSHERGVVPTEATYKLLVSQEDVEKLSADEINRLIVKEFQYDDFRWQFERGIHVCDPERAKGLHRVLYQCPHCKKEFQMNSYGTTLECTACSKKWTMTELGTLEAQNGQTEFSHIPDWYEWQRANVRKEVESGTYKSGPFYCTVDSLPKDHFISIGAGSICHDMNGFHVVCVDQDGDIHQMERDAKSLYSVHIEYQYLFKHGDCVDLNTLEDTWYIYPESAVCSVTKMALATEELYFFYKRQAGITMPDGLA